jgi:ABC-type branched-subunit amino acid transport system substrate-binding protein
MTKKSIYILIATIFTSVNIIAQVEVSATKATAEKQFHVAIFAPLYLDSAFDGTTYNYKGTFPKFSQQGFDFVQGAMIALDSLPMPKESIVAHIYDSKSKEQSVQWLIANDKLDEINLIIGSVKDAELIRLSAFAKQKNVPFISATSPSDGGNFANPFFIMLSASLMGHCESIHSFLIQNHGTDKIYLCRKAGAQEDKIAQNLKAINEEDGSALLNIETIDIEGDDFSILESRLDSNRSSIVIGGSLNEDFAIGISKQLHSMKEIYPVELIGMPNWESFSELKKEAYDNLPIMYTISYNNPKSDSKSRLVSNAYEKKFDEQASDMVYKGFEAVHTFVRLVVKYNIDFTSHLNDAFFKSYSEFNFKPVFLKKGTNFPDYFENKHLFLMKMLNGKVTRF